MRGAPRNFQYPQSDRLRFNYIPNIGTCCKHVPFSIRNRIDFASTRTCNSPSHTCTPFQYPQSDRLRFNRRRRGVLAGRRRAFSIRNRIDFASTVHRVFPVPPGKYPFSIRNRIDFASTLLSVAQAAREAALSVSAIGSTSLQPCGPKAANTDTDLSVSAIGSTSLQPGR